MLGFLFVLAIVFIIWVLYGRGAYIVYKHKKDEGTVIPEGFDKDSVMEALKKDLGYKDAKEIFFDERGEICIEGKNDTYVIEIKDGRIYLDDPMMTNIDDSGNKAVTFLAKIGSWRLRTTKKNRRCVEEIECIRAYIAKVFDHNAPVNANKKYTSMCRARKYSGVVSLVCVALAVILLVVSINSASKNQQIDGIKYAHLTAFSREVTIGEAFDDFFADGKWEAYTEDSDKFVKFSGTCSYYGESAKMVVTFEYVDDDSFEVKKMVIDGESLGLLEMSAVLEVIFDSYGE